MSALERFLERLVERPIGRLFRAPVELEQLGRRVERAMEGGRRSERGRTIAPDRFRILLDPSDLAGLLRRSSSPEARLGEVAHAYARQRGWQLRQRPVVTLHDSAVVARGDIVVDAGFAAVGDVSAAGRLSDDASMPVLEATAVLPAVAPEALILVVACRGRPDRRVVIGPSVVRIGRAVDNEVVLTDERVSRHHGLITSSQGLLVYRDLASANGSFLRGQRVSEVALGPGDELTLGSTSLRLVRP